ncbi:MAG TPA: hypothetical protein VF221_16330 [Chloroflexota bacterium]
MDVSFFSDPVLLSVLGSIFKGAIILLLIIGFIPGVIVGWLFGKAT